MTKHLKPSHLWDDAILYPAALGCVVCPLRDRCGGLHCKATPLDCHEFCCGGASNCTTVCKNNSLFIDQYAEVFGFDLKKILRSPVPLGKVDEKIVPLVYHGSKRERPNTSDAICVRLYDLIDFSTGRARHKSPSHLRSEMRLHKNCEIIVSGVDHDPKIEAVWRLGERRRSVFRQLAQLDLAGISTPNFSMVLDRPRSDDLHSMSRIGIVFAEMAEAGLPVWLHPNARTEFDMKRWWSDFMSMRPDIETIAYEFITGAGRKGRIEEHCRWLNDIARRRPLSIVIRGNPLATELLTEFENVTYIEATSFIKAVNRQWPIRASNSTLIWRRREADMIDRHLELAQREMADILKLKYPRLRAD